MTTDNTQVDVEELQKFATGAYARTTDTRTVSNTLSDVHLGVDMLGAISTAFVNRVVAEQQDLDSKLRAMAEALTQDGNAAHTNAKAVADNEATQTSQFKQTGQS